MKTPEILEHLRRRIVSGEFPPGSKLPNRPELLAEYSVSVSAFQKCINQLIEWNFLESRGMKGIRVTANPPHLSRYALVFPTLPDHNELPDDTLYRSVKYELPAFQAEHPEIYFEFYRTGTAEAPVTAEFERLLADVSRGLLAGIIFFFFAPSREIQKKLGNFPCVVVSRDPNDTQHHYPFITFDTVELFRMCRERLLERGAKRIAVLVHSMLASARLTQIAELCADGRAFTPPEWILGLFHETGRPVLKRNLIRLLFSGLAGQRPDSLIVLNENLLPIACDALAELGLTPGVDVRIASHSNYPFEKEPLPQVDYFVFQVHDILENSFQQLTAREPHSLRILLQPHAISTTQKKEFLK